MLWLDLIAGKTAIALIHAAMLPLMLIVMFWRRSEFTG